MRRWASSNTLGLTGRNPLCNRADAYACAVVEWIAHIGSREIRQLRKSLHEELGLRTLRVLSFAVCDSQSRP